MKSVKPGRGPSLMGGVMSLAVAVFGVIWTVLAYSMGAGLFALFGVVFAAAAAINAGYEFLNATRKNRFSSFDVVDSQEEPDPLNQTFGKMQSETQENRFCPYCGASAHREFEYCSRCGKKLP